MTELMSKLGQEVGGRYLLVELLGSGGMGAVYGAVHRVTGRRVALKRLHPQFASVDAIRRRFLREAQAVGALGHPGIVDVLDAGLDADGQPFVVFERLEGEDLAQAFSGGSMPRERVLEVAIEVLDALGAAHARGFVHRDVKPANIFLTPGRVKLLDFGIVRPVGMEHTPLTEAGALIGTPSFMSPEALAGSPVDGRADLWSVAVVVYRGLTGRLPFTARSAMAVAVEMLRGIPAPSQIDPTLPGEADRTLAKALDPDIGARFATADELRSALRVLRRALGPVGPKTSGYAWEAAVGRIAEETSRLRRARPEPTVAVPRPSPGATPWWRRLVRPGGRG